MDVETAELTVSSGSETDNNNESEEETMTSAYRKGKSGAFNMLAEVRLFSSLIRPNIFTQ